MTLRLIDDLISRLETRRMSVPGLRCMWCSACLRLVVTDPAIKKSDLLCSGQEDCRQPMDGGTITECIDALREEAKAGQ